MWPNPHFLADFVTFTEEILKENFIFCAVWVVFYLAGTVQMGTHPCTPLYPSLYMITLY